MRSFLITLGLKEVFSLNAVAREIWLAIQRTNSVDGGVAELIQLYQIDSEGSPSPCPGPFQVHREAGLLE